MLPDMVERRSSDAIDADPAVEDSNAPAPSEDSGSAADRSSAKQTQPRKSPTPRTARQSAGKTATKAPAKRKTSTRKSSTSKTKAKAATGSAAPTAPRDDDPEKPAGPKRRKAAPKAKASGKPTSKRTDKSTSTAGTSKTRPTTGDTAPRVETGQPDPSTTQTKPAAPASAAPGPAGKPATARVQRQRVDAPALSPFRSALRQIHRLVLDRAESRLERVTTATEAPIDGMKIVGADRSQTHDYRPSPRKLVRWVLDGLADTVEQTTFLDIGSGRGRVLFEAARYPFQRIVGIECAEDLHEDAALNLRHWPRAQMRCREVDLILGDALDQPLPKGDLVVWMFDPFSERLMTRMAARLAKHAGRWNVTIVLVEPHTTMAFEQSSAYRKVELPRPIRQRIALFSPYPIAVFAAGPSRQ